MKKLCPKFFFLFGFFLLLPQLMSASFRSVVEECQRLDGGDPITAGTVVYFDNSKGFLSSGGNDNVYMSVSSASNAGLVEPSMSYVPKNDDWYPMELVEGSNGIYKATVTANNSNGRVSFWNIDMSTYNNPSEANGFFNIPFDADNTYYVPSVSTSPSPSNPNSSDWCWQSDRKVNYSTKGEWKSEPDIVASYIYSETFYVDAEEESFTLKAYLMGERIPSGYRWEARQEDGTEWTTIETTTAPELTINKADFPVGNMVYRVVVLTSSGEVESLNTWRIAFAPTCDGETSSVVVFEQTFGIGDSYRYRVPESEVSADIPDTYTYRGDFNEKINDGQMAIVADPYWCGCGDGKDMAESIDNCMPEDRNPDEGKGSSNWYRAYVYPTAGFPEADRIKFRDHTINEQSDNASEYGLCLLINYADNSNNLAYQHILTPEEKAEMVPGSKVRLTAHIASIAKYWSEQQANAGVKMTISIDFKGASEADWRTLVSASQEVWHHDNWYPIVTEEFELGDVEEGDYRIQIYSSRRSGIGHDIVIDDIRLVACQPVIRNYLEYVDGSGQTQQSDDVTMQKHDDEFTLVVPKFDTGLLGEDPQVMLFVYDEGEYTYVGDLEYDSDAERYTINVSKSYMDGSSKVHHFEAVPDQVQFVTVATTKEAGKGLVSDIESGAIDPVNSTDCYRSENIITLSTACKAAPVISIAEGSSAYICAENPMAYPDVKIEFDNFTDEVQYKITSTQSGDNGATVSSEWIDVTADELTKGELTAALNGMAEWSWQAGQTYSVSVAVKEFFFGSNGRVEICERTAESGVTFYVRPLPGLTAELQDTEMCRGQEDKQITAAVNSSTNTYKWQVSKDNGQTWEDAEGTNTNRTYVIPSTAENGWQYRMQLSYVSQAYTCGPVETAPLTLTVSDCEDYQLSQTINLEGQDGVCPGEEFTITLAIKNLSQDTGQQDVEIAVILPEGLARVGEVEGHQGASYWDPDNRKLWCHFGDLPPATTYNITWILRYDEVEGRTENVTEAVKAWISKSNDIEYATYDDQTTGSWRDYDNLLLKAKSPEPVSNLTAGGYVACATEGTLDLATLVSANGTQTWYSDQTLTQVVADTQLDANQAIRTTYYVTNTVEGQCESDAVPVPVWIKEISTTPVVNTELVNEDGTYEICASGTSQTMELSTLLAGTYENLTWYSDAALTQEFVPAEIDMTVAQDVTYYVTNTETGKCPSAAVAVRILIKANTEAPTVIVDAEGYAYNECAVVGSKPLSELVSSDKSGLRWYDESGNEIVNPVFDTAAAGEYVCYVTNTNPGECESEKAEVRIRIKAISAKPTVDTDANGYAYNECAAESGTLSLSTLVEAPYETLTWYTDAALTQEFVPAEIDMTVAQDVTYYVTNTETGKCPSAAVAVRILIKANTEAPTVIVDAEGYAYNECAVVGSKPLSELVSSDKSGLKWYDESGNEIVNPVFDTAAAGEYVYYVTNTNPGECESEKAEVRIRIKAISAKPTVDTDANGYAYNECAAESGTLSLSTLVEAPYETLTWYTDAALTQEFVPAEIDMTVAQDVTYYVTNTETGKCPSAAVAVRILIKANTEAPTVIVDAEGYAYDECAVVGSKPLSELVSSDNSGLKWYDESGNEIEIDNPEFDTAAAGEYVYYVTNTNPGECESEKAEVRIRISANSTRPEVTDYDECAKSGTYSLSDLVMSDKTNLEWFDSNMQPLADATFDKSVPGNTTYYVRNTVSGECSSDMSEVHVNIKDQAVASDITADDMEVCTGASATLTVATSITDNDLVFTWYDDADLLNVVGTGATLQITGPEDSKTYYVTVKGANTCENQPGDAAEAAVYAIAPIDNVRLEPVEERIGMGKETEKTLTVEPTDAYYTAVWTANGQVIADPDSYFPAKPYSDVEYKVVVTDECGNTIEASAITKVVWPTIITPQNMDGKNDDFLVGMQEDIHLEIFDRWGNVVYSGNDGWHQSEAAQKMPGVYYYIATLPDGTAKQGTIEVYK